jgi:hypothetical protein
MIRERGRLSAMLCNVLGTAGVLAAGLVFMTGCSMDRLVKDQYPPNVTPPSALQTEDGAISMYHAAIYAFRQGFGGQCGGNGCYVVVSGAFTDELQSGVYMTGNTPGTLQPDALSTIGARNMEADQTLRTATIEYWYRYFNLARNSAVDGIYYLTNFAPLQPKDLIGNMYIIRGLSMTYLADMFCSGIPLTDYDPVSGFTYKPGSTTDEVYTTALAEFDSALTNTPDSLNFHYMAEVGKGRVLLDLGRFADAAAAVSDVPTSGWQYVALYDGTSPGAFNNNYTNAITNTAYDGNENSFGTIGDREGTNGLPFVSANDPRVPLVRSPAQNPSYPATTYMLPKWMFPTGAPFNGSSTRAKGGQQIVVSNGIEARLIEAEVKAQANDASYLDILNTLRTDGTQTGGVYNAGTGGVAGLAPLTDPGTQQARLKQVFDERGYWFFLTGHRQGDLRRMVRVYKFPQNQVYPTGPYPLGDTRAYGTYTNLPIPYTEQQINPQYKGCFNRDA